jgi:hypothetical protein
LNSARIFSIGHPSYGKRKDARIHCSEGLQVDFISTEMTYDDLEPCCLAYTIVSVDPEVQAKTMTRMMYS